MSSVAADIPRENLGPLAGLWLCIRFTARRNRWFYGLWILGLSMLMPMTVTKYHEIIEPGLAGSMMLNQLANDPAMRAICGLPIDLTTAGGFTVWRVGTFTAAALAMMAGLGVVRSTRGEEEPGRLELLRSGAIGRHAPLLAAIIVALAACFAVGLAQIPLMVANDAPLSGSVAAGLAMALTGSMWVGVGAVCAQVFESTRSATSWALGVVLGGGYMLRAIVDANSGDVVEKLRWLMPLDWFALVHAYAGDRWWVLTLPAATTSLLIVLALWLEGRRDLGSGLRPQALGRSHAAAYLRDERGLAWRLMRGSLAGWALGLWGSAAGMGSLALTVEDMLAKNPQLAQMFRKLGGDSAKLSDAFYVAMLGILVVLVALAGALILTRMRSEETSGRLEPLLATSIPRLRYACTQLGWAFTTSTLLLLGVGLLLPVAQAAKDSDIQPMERFLGAAAAFLPGVWLVLGLAMFLIGWAPRLLSLVWAILGWTFFAAWLAPLFDLPSWLAQFTPWGHLPHLPGDELTWTAIIAETTSAAVLMGLGLWGFRRRDLHQG